MPDHLRPLPISASQCQFELAVPYIIIDGLLIPGDPVHPCGEAGLEKAEKCNALMILYKHVLIQDDVHVFLESIFLFRRVGGDFTLLMAILKLRQLRKTSEIFRFSSIGSYSG